MEVWKPIPFTNYDTWEVSNKGNIRHRKRLNNLKFKSNKGHLMISLGTKVDKRWFLVHRLVALAFLDKPEGKDIVNHKNGVKGDNRVENLEWCTAAENTEHHFSNFHDYKTERKYLSINRIRRIYKSQTWSSVEDFIDELEKVADSSYQKHKLTLPS